MGKTLVVENFSKKRQSAVVDIAPVRPFMHLPKKCMVFDTTLRDGEQTPGVAFSFAQKKEIAFALDDAGVDVLEAGFPVASGGERDFFKEIASAGLKNAKLCGLARCDFNDIDAAINSNANYVHIFIATSPIHMKYKLKLSQEEVLEKAVECTKYVKAAGLPCEFSAEDATRSDFAFLKQVYEAVQDAGADKINVPDTVGATIPMMMNKLVYDLSQTIKIPIAVHCHDDFGLAVANTLAAVEGGARQVHCTVNGLGERAGNASLEETVSALNFIYGVQCNVDAKKLYALSQLVSRHARAWPSINKAIVGENAFSHGAGIHVHGVLAHSLAYEPIDPALVGQKRKIVYGKLTGAHAIKARIEELGFNASDAQLEQIVGKVKHLGDLGKKVRDFELDLIAHEVLGKKREANVVLEEASICTGNKAAPVASISLIVNGKKLSAKNVAGDGAVDAAIKAIQKAFSQAQDFELKSYKLEAISGGSDALCEVTVLISGKNGKEASGSAVGGDIVMTSVDAVMDALNAFVK